MIDEDLDKKIRMIQGKRIQTENTSVSYSKVINEYWQMVLKNDSRHTKIE